MIEILINNNGWHYPAKLVRLGDGRLFWYAERCYVGSFVPDPSQPILYMNRRREKLGFPFEEGDLERVGADPPDFWDSVEDNLRKNKDVND